MNPVADVIRGYRFTYATERDLQEGIAEALGMAGYRVEREVYLGQGCRIDLMVDGRVGIEVKIQGSVEDVYRQIVRYLQHIDEVILVSGRAAHARLAGPRVEVVSLAHGALL